MSTSSIVSQPGELTLVTNRLKLYDTSGKLKGSLCVLSSRGLPGPPFLVVPCGSFGRFGGRREPSRRSETLVDSEDELASANLRESGGGSEEGGKVEVCLFGCARSGEVEVMACGVGIGMAEEGIKTYEGTVVIDDSYLEPSLEPSLGPKSPTIRRPG